MGKLVEITWMDSCSPTRKWVQIEEAKEYTPAICKSAGWVQRNDKYSVVIAGSRGSDEVGDITAIPKSVILEIKRLS